MPQHEPLLPDISVLVPLPHHRAILWRGVAVHWVPGHVHAHWQLCIFAHGLDRLGFPDHHDLPHHVSFNTRIKHRPLLTTIRAVYVQGRNKFNANGQSASVGVKAFAFMWTAVACLMLACMFYCMGGAVGRKERGYSGREHRRRGFFSSARSNSVRSNKETAP